MNAKSKTVNIAQLSNNEKNPREITNDDFEKLIDSIVTFPEMLRIRPMVVDGTLSVLGGNMRLRALNAIKPHCSNPSCNSLISNIRIF